MFHINMKEIIRTHKLIILIIIEPRISGREAEEACLKLGKSDWARSEAMGFSDGIGALWNREEIHIEIVHVCKHFVHSLMTPRGNESWEMTAIYASMSSQRRVAMWEELKLIQVRHPWLCLGNFNCTL